MKTRTWMIYALVAATSPCPPLLSSANAVEAIGIRAATGDPSTIYKRFDAALKSNDYQTALREGEQFEAAMKQKFGQNHEAYASALHNLGLVHERMRQYDRAEFYYLRALAIRDSKGKKIDLAWTLFNLSNVYGQQKKYDQAESLLVRALALREQALGKDHPDTAQTLHNLGLATRNQGKYPQSVAYFRRALEVRERNKEIQRIDLRWTLANLGMAYFDMKDVDQARALAKRAIDPTDTSPASAEITALLKKVTSDEDQSLKARYAAIQKLEAERKYREVLEVGKKFVEDARLFYGEKNRVYGFSLIGMGGTLQRFGDHGAAAKYYEKAVLIDEAPSSDADTERYRQIARRALGNVHSNLSNYSAAERYRRAVIEIGERGIGQGVLPGDLDNLASTLVDLKKYEEAHAIYSKEKELLERTKGVDHADTIDVLHGFAYLERKRGNFVEAERLYTQALEAKERVTGPNSLGSASSMRRLAGFYRIVGRYEEAETLYRKTLAMRLQGNEKEDLIANAMHDLAMTVRARGKYAEAEEFYKKAIDLREKAIGHGHPSTAWSINNLGHAYLEQGRYEDAQPLFEEALRIRQHVFGSVDVEAVPIRQNIAELKLINGDIPDAIAMLRENLDLRVRELGENNEFVGYSLEKLSEALEKSGDNREALRLLERSLAIRAASQPKGHPDIAQARYKMAGVLQKLNRNEEAAKALGESLEINLASVGEVHPDTAATLQRMAEVYAQLGRLDDALDASRRAVRSTIELANLDESNASIDAGFKEDIPAKRAQLFKSHAALLYLRAASQPAQRDTLIDEALASIQRAGSSSASRAIQKAAARIATGDAAASDLIRKRQDLALQLTALEAERRQILASQSADSDPHNEKIGYRNITGRIAQIEAQLAEMTKTVDASAPRYKSLVEPSPLTVKDIQGVLQPDEAVVVYMTGQKDGLVVAISKDVANWGRLSDNVQMISDTVREFRNGLDPDALRASALGGKPQLFDLQRSHELYAMLVGPVEDVLKGKKRIDVVPDGPLTSLPFHLLITERPATAVLPFKDIAQYRDQAWLLRKAAIKIVPAVSNLQTVREATANSRAPRAMIAFGDPIFNPAERKRTLAEAARGNKRLATATRAYTSIWQGAGIDRNRLREALPTLLDSGQEVKNIGRKLGVPESDILVEGNATETNVKRRQLSDYQIVYFATHGLVAGDVKGLAEPSLALTIPDTPSEEDDGILTLSEVSTLKLNADLVVLSACNTIAGDRPGAEALTGLARAFFYAGAKAMVVSHWALASDAATRIMTDTFGLLQAEPSLDRAEALRRAILDYMNDRSNPLNGYPAYWAPLVVVGGGG
ncbi:CHAT domain-containing protein [Bradyrhizobium sp. NC92]|uniref:CHAT domain-containing tetratricopeptide repeat protein n=1 Tax=Bradyrhizobium sp. (strain NC92) TaxID=55395 RepID=UPI0021AA9DF0|nr:CHAT domain-containing protein [Bradyrhizobium sp. NC92]UWU67299.1 CHAT domain-containing protein [Bradyrhizobium sp. NC92]